MLQLILFSLVIINQTNPLSPYTWHGDRWITGDLYVNQVYGNVDNATIADILDQYIHSDLEGVFQEIAERFYTIENSSHNHGTGTVGAIAKFIDDATIGNSILFELENKVGVGTTNPSHTLDVSGTAQVSNLINLAASNSNLPSRIAIEIGSDNYLRWQDWSTFRSNLNFSEPTHNHGTGTVGTIAKFVGDATIGDSNILEFENKIGIGTIPSYTLDINGTARALNIINQATSTSNTPSRVAIETNSDNYVRWQDWTTFRTNLNFSESTHNHGTGNNNYFPVFDSGSFGTIKNSTMYTGILYNGDYYISGNGALMTDWIIPSGYSHNYIAGMRNLLYNATLRPECTVTQEGAVKFSSTGLSALFNGSDDCAIYASGDVQPATPIIITVTFPYTHPQLSNWYFGWTSRYYYPTQFKIEARNYSTGEWITFVDIPWWNQRYYFDTFYYQAYVNAVRFTIYDSASTLGLQIGELYFGSIEAGDPYSNLYVRSRGDSMYGTLNFSNVSSDITTSSGEHLSIVPGTGGNVGIKKSNPAYDLDISGTVQASNIINLAASTSSTPSRVAVETGSDNYLRWQDWSTFRSNLNFSEPTHDHGTGTAGTIAKFTGTSTIGDSRIVESGNAVGIGSTYSYAALNVDQVSTFGIYLKDTLENPASYTYSIYNYFNPVYSVTATRYGFAAAFNNVVSVNGGYSNTGSQYGTTITAFRNNFAGQDDNGSLDNLLGMSITYGHYNSNASDVPATSNVYGLYLSPYYRTGTIGNLYDIYIAEPSTGSATKPVHYSIYQNVTDATNIIRSYTSIGTTTQYPAPYKLGVGGSIYAAGALNTQSPNYGSYPNHVLHDLYNHYFTSATGALVIIPPEVSGTATRVKLTITGRALTSNVLWRILCDFYWYSSSYHSTSSAQIEGAGCPFTEVYYALHSNGQPRIILGPTTASQYYGYISLDEVNAAHLGGSEWVKPNWKISDATTDISGYTIVRTPTIQSYKTASGNIGYATTAPQARIHVQDGQIQISRSSSYSTFRAEYTTGNKKFEIGTSLVYSYLGYSSSGYFSLGTITGWDQSGWSEKARLDASGNFGLGITPQYKLDVNGSARIVGSSLTTTPSHIAVQSGSDNVLKWQTWGDFINNLAMEGEIGGGNIGGTGSAGYIAKFIASATLANSLLYESGSQVTVNGNFRSTGSLAGETLSVGNVSKANVSNATISDASGQIPQDDLEYILSTLWYKSNYHNHGTGTTNYIPKWSGTGGTLTDSLMYESAGKIIVGASVGINTDPVEALEFAENNRMKLSTNRTHLDQSSLIRLQWTSSTGKPAIGWFDESGNRRAAVVAHDYLTYPSERHQHLSFETSDAAGSLQTRLEIPWGKNTVDIETHDSNLKVAGGGSFVVSSGTAAIMGYAGFGTLNPSYAVDIYTSNDKKGFVHRISAGERIQSYIDSSGNGRFRVMNNSNNVMAQIHSSSSQSNYFINKTGIGTSSPNEMLDVNGNAAIAGKIIFDSSADIRIKFGELYNIELAPYTLSFQSDRDFLFKNNEGISLFKLAGDTNQAIVYSDLDLQSNNLTQANKVKLNSIVFNSARTESTESALLAALEDGEVVLWKPGGSPLAMAVKYGPKDLRWQTLMKLTDAQNWPNDKYALAIEYNGEIYLAQVHRGY